MMGVLDTHDDWQSLLKANLMGIIVGSSSDIADIGKLSYRKDPKAPKTEIPKIDLSDETLTRETSRSATPVEVKQKIETPLEDVPEVVTNETKRVPESQVRADGKEDAVPAAVTRETDEAVEVPPAVKLKTPETPVVKDEPVKHPDKSANIPEVPEIKPEEFAQKKAEFMERLKNDNEYKSYLESIENSITNPKELAAKIAMFEFAAAHPEKISGWGAEALSRINADNIDKARELYKFFANENILNDDAVSTIVMNMDSADGVKLLYNALKHDTELLTSDTFFMVPHMFCHVKAEDVPSKVEIYNILNEKSVPKDVITSVIADTNAKNINAAKVFLERGVKPEDLNTLLCKVDGSGKDNYEKCSIEFLLDNYEFIKTLDWSISKQLNETNIDVIKAMQTSQYFPKGKTNEEISKGYNCYCECELVEE